MEFWGLEVKPGQTVKCEPEDDHFLHLSQGALGESKKDDKATMYVKVGNKKLSIGTLSTDRFPQIQFDLVFEKEFELSHTSKTASVFFSGYKVFQPAEGDEMDFDSEGSEDEEEEEIIIPATKENGKAEGKDKEQKRQVKIDAAASKPKAVAKDVGKNKKDDDESEDDDSDDFDSDDSDEGLTPIEGDDADLSEDDTSEDEDESDDDEEEETPKKPETGKKRAAESALKTPASDKKAKATTPSGQKTGDKKGHVATPHPAKKASKTPATNEKSPKSGGSVACKSCSKTFNSEMALQSHSKAKHEAK